MKIKIANKTEFIFIEFKNIIYILLIFSLILSLSEVANAACVGETLNFECEDIVTQNCTLNSSSTSSGTCFTIGADNITIDGAGYSITGSAAGYGIYAIGRNNVTIKNINVYNFSYGIYLSHSSNNKLTSNTANNNQHHGIHLYSSSNNTLAGNTANNNDLEGIRLEQSLNNTLTSNSANDNHYAGILLYSSSNNTITNNTANNSKRHGDHGIYLYNSSNNAITSNSANDNVFIGIRLDSSSNNTLANNTANNNGFGIRLDSSQNNALTSNTANSNYQGINLSSSSNNTLKGNEISNNNIGIYSADSNSTINSNVVCNNINLDFNSPDWLSSSGDDNTCGKPDGWNDTNAKGCTYTCDTCLCNSCDECEEKLNNDLCQVVKLTQDINNHVGICINNPAGFNNKVFDCQGHEIDGDDNGSDYGIYLESKTKNTIKNCIITDFNIGIVLYQSTYNTLTNNTASSNIATGIAISGDFAQYNTLTNNILNSNGYYGMSASGYWCSLKYNYAYNNTLCGNEVRDVSTCRSYNIYGENNTCDTFFTRDFGSGMMGCENSCYEEIGNNTCYCDSCDTCEEKLSNTSCRVVELTQDINNYVGTCINNSFGFNNKIFDCQGHEIDGDDNGSDYGIYLESKTKNTIRNCIITDFNIGIVLYQSTYNTITNNTASSNIATGIAISGDSAQYNTLTDNILNSNGYYGMSSSGYWCSLKYNYAYNNTMCGNEVRDVSTCRSYNVYGENNTCDTFLTRDFGSGIMGCEHSCYEEIGNNICYCDSCDTCEEKLSNISCGVVKLTQDINNHIGTCINNSFGFNNKVFDCQGHEIDGDDNGSDYGIYLESKTKNTIRNCIITDFNIGIVLYQSTYNTITNNTASSNIATGIAISGDFAQYNTLTDNTLNSNGYGMSASGYWCSLKYNYAYNNTLCGNEVQDVSTCRSYNIYGENNTCDTFLTRDFGSGMVGCNYSCSGNCSDNDGDEYNGITAECSFGTDCNDDNPYINTNAMEICNGMDDNCNGLEDENGVCFTYYYCDNDSDGFISTHVFSETCNSFNCTPSGCQKPPGDDCDDTNSGVNPNALEICGNYIDENCNGYADENCTICDDGETRQCGTDVGACEFGVQTCINITWGACIGGINPVSEICDGIDNDCEGFVDDNLTKIRGCGLGVCSGGIQTQMCTNGSWILWSNCSTSINAVDEICGNNLDDDCDGLTDYYDSNDCILKEHLTLIFDKLNYHLNESVKFKVVGMSTYNNVSNYNITFDLTYPDSREYTKIFTVNTNSWNELFIAPFIEGAYKISIISFVSGHNFSIYPANYSVKILPTGNEDFLILTNPQKLFDIYNYNEVDELLNISEDIARMQNGVVGYTYETDAEQIDDEIENKWRKYLGDDWATNGHLMIVGDDNIIPFFREPNPTWFADDDPFIASDDRYSDMNGDDYVDLSIGRIVGDISLMTKQLTTGYNGGDNAMILSGYIFINSADYIERLYYETGFNTADSAIVDNGYTTWNMPPCPGNLDDYDLRQAIINHEISDKSIIYYGFQSDYDGWGGCWINGIPPLLEVSEINVADGSMIYSIGCHNGQVVPFGSEEMNVNNNMALRFLYEGASNFLGNTGYGYGGSNKDPWNYVTNEWSETLLAYFTENVLKGQDFGTALKNAKRTYREHQYGGIFKNYDKKVVLELLLYGNPKNGLAANIPIPSSAVNILSPDDMKNLEAGALNMRIENISVETVNGTDYILLNNISLSIDGKLINYIKFYVGSEYGPLVPQIMAEMKLPKGYLINNVILNDSFENTENIISDLNLSIRIPQRADGNAPLSSPVDLNSTWYTDVYDYNIIEDPDGTQILVLRIYPYSFSNNIVHQNLSFDADYNRKLLVNLSRKGNETEDLGLNLISLPLNTTIKKASELAKKIPGCEAVWHRVNGSYIGYPAENNSYHVSDFNITPGEAYFVSVSENSTWEIIGKERGQIAINLSGYPSVDKHVINLIELPIDTNITTAEYLAAAIPGCEAPGLKTVTTWDPTKQEFIDYISGYPINNFEIIPGRGYIISTCENTTWVI